MKGRRIVDEKVHEAQALRERGFSIREISRRLNIGRFSKLLAKTGNETSVQKGLRGLQQVHDMMKDYLQHNYPGFPLPSLQRPDAGQNRSGDSVRMSPRVARAFAELQQETRMLNEAQIRNLINDCERSISRSKREIQEYDSRIPDLVREPHKRDRADS